MRRRPAPAIAEPSRGPRLRNWRKKSMPLVEAIENIFRRFDDPMSTRQVYYQCISLAVCENSDRAYEKIQRLVVQMRRASLIPYDRVVDRTRSKYQSRGWEGVADLLQSANVQFRRDYWAEQEVIPFVALEKQALEGVLCPVVDEYGASLWVFRGFGSEGFVYEMAQEMIRLRSEGKKPIVFYFGDHDASGLAIEVDAIGKLRAFGASFEWQRCGLLREDIEAFSLIQLPVKRKDSRAGEYLARFGDCAAELDALPPAELTRRVRSAIESCIDMDAWERIRRAEKLEKESLDMIAINWDVAVDAAMQQGGSR